MSNYRFRKTGTTTQIDIEATYGLIFEKGADAELWKFPARKDNGLSISFVDESGTDRYLDNPKFESRTIHIPCVIFGNNRNDVITKLRSLQNFLISSGRFDLIDLAKQKLWKVYYNSLSNMELYDNFCKFTVEIIDDYPTENFTI